MKEPQRRSLCLQRGTCGHSLAFPWVEATLRAQGQEEGRNREELRCLQLAEFREPSRIIHSAAALTALEFWAEGETVTE